MVLLSLWFSKTGLDIGIYVLCRIVRLAQKPKVIPISWFTISLLLCLWFLSPIVTAKEFGGPIYVEYKTNAREIEFSSRANRIVFEDEVTPTLIRWWALSFAYGPETSIHNHFSFGNNQVKSFENLAFYSRKNLPFNITRKGSDIWIHTGTNDPFCYIQVTYVEQFWESYSPETYCYKHMHDNRCTYISNELQKVETHSLLSARKILHCYGFKGSFSEIRSGKSKNWSQLYTTGPMWLQTLHGEFMFYENRGTYYWVSPYAAVAAVAYHHDVISGMIIEHYAWKRIEIQRFTLAQASSLEALLEKVGFYAVEKNSDMLEGYNISSVTVEKCDCDKVGWVKVDWRTGPQLTSILGRNITKTSTRLTYVLPTCELSKPGLMFGDCFPIPIENFFEITTHSEIEYNDEKSWYKALVEDFFAMLRTFLGAMVTYVLKSISDLVFSLGAEIVLLFLIPYLLTVRIYGNIPAIFVSFVCTLFGYMYLNLASEDIDALVG